MSDGVAPKRESPDHDRPITITYLSGSEQREVVFNPVRYICKIWLSTVAIEGLTNLAPILKCGPYVGSVLSSLPGNPLLYRDERPDTLTDLDIPLLEAGRFPTWDLEYERVPFHVGLPRNTQTKLLRLSMHWSITNHRIPASYRQPMGRMQAVAEAIGQHLLTFDVGGSISPIYPNLASPAVATNC